MRRVFKVAVLVIFLADVSLMASVPRASAQNGRTLRIGMTQEPATLDPIVGTLAVETDIDQLVYSGLTRYDEHGNLVPDLAAEVPTRANGGISSDGRVITYHLVHNARWQDGVPVTSADVKFTYNAIMNPNNDVVGRVLYEEIARVETPDPYTVRLVLKRPWAPVLDAFGDSNQGAIECVEHGRPRALEHEPNRIRVRRLDAGDLFVENATDDVVVRVHDRVVGELD